jgi:uncharacterized protein
MELAFWSFVLRFGQSGLDAALTLVIGVITAGIFRRMLTPAGTRKLFGSGVRGLASGWLAGMLLPVCSLGVIPVAREMRRSGVPGGTVLSFVLAAPLLNPISFLYGLTLAEPKVILTFAGLSLLLSTVAGLLWDRFFAKTGSTDEAKQLAAQADTEAAPPVGIRRILAVGVTACKELAGRDLVFYVIGLTGTALLGALIPFGALQHSMKHSDPSSTVVMTLLAVPLFCSPLSGMMKLGLMFDHGNSIGAAFVLFAIGIGTSLGTIAWLLKDFGWKRILPWFLGYLVLVCAIGYGCEAMLYDTRKAEIDHTHAFDDYSSPFSTGQPDLTGSTRTKLAEKFGPLEQPAVYCFSVMLILGFALKLLERRWSLEAWLTKQPKPSASAKRSKWDMVLPGWLLGVIALIGLVVFSVLGAYIYYPNRQTCMDQMFAIYAEAAVAVRTDKPEEAIRQLEQWDQIIRKLEVGTYLRNFCVTPEQSSTAAELREAIEEVRDELIAKNPTGAKEKFKTEVENTYRLMKQAYPK